MKRIIHVLSIDASRDDVFAAIATVEGLSSWWSTRVEGKGGSGGEIRFTFRDPFHPVMKVTSQIEDERVEWTCTSGHEPWADNTFSFALEESGERVQLTFEQHYAQELSDVAYGTYNFNWGYYLDSLKMYCEKGRGKPFVVE